MDAKLFQKHLENNLIPFWNRMKDDKNGGFYGYADSDGKPDKKKCKGSYSQQQDSMVLLISISASA